MKSHTLNICIYCGEVNVDKLTDEHIIPYGWGKPGMAGDVLNNASCYDCADVTKRFEQYVLRNIFGNVRRVMKLRSRKKKNDEYINQRVKTHQGKIKTISVPSNEFVDTLYLPIFDEPGLMQNNAAKKDCNIQELQLINIGNKSTLKTYISNNVSEVYAQTQYKNHAFEKFLLKIAYCSAVKGFGYDKLKGSPIPKLILGIDLRFGTFLGCIEHQTLPTKKLSNNEAYWVKYGSYEAEKSIMSAIKLFANIDEFNEYLVVVKPKLFQ